MLLNQFLYILVTEQAYFAQFKPSVKQSEMPPALNDADALNEEPPIKVTKHIGS